MAEQTDGRASSERSAHGAQEIRRVVTLGSSVLVKGELTGCEDLTVDGRVEGQIHLPDHALTIGPDANIQAEVVAKVVTVFGSIVGGITAGDKVEICRGGSVKGDLACTRIAIQDGGHFCGKVNMGARQPSHRGAEIRRVVPAAVVA